MRPNGLDEEITAPPMFARVISRHKRPKVAVEGRFPESGLLRGWILRCFSDNVLPQNNLPHSWTRSGLLIETVSGPRDPKLGENIDHFFSIEP